LWGVDRSPHSNAFLKPKKHVSLSFGAVASFSFRGPGTVAGCSLAHSSHCSPHRSHVISSRTLHCTLHRTSLCRHKEMHSNVVLTCFRQPLCAKVVAFAPAIAVASCFAGYPRTPAGIQHYYRNYPNIWRLLDQTYLNPHERGIVLRRRLPPQQSRS
jgi:hypothetical protein